MKAFEDISSFENEDIEKKYEEYMLDILYHSGYMEH
jgi:hypothetical protein